MQKFRPDLRMLTSQSSYALYEVHSNEGRFREEEGEREDGGEGGGGGKRERERRREGRSTSIIM